MQTLLKENDRISMKNSIEIRCPTDIDIIKLIPKNKIYNKKFFKKIFFQMYLNLLIKVKNWFLYPLTPLYNSNKKNLIYIYLLHLIIFKIVVYR